uniref:Pentapeptide repeat-containing protein n=1 Tax=Candidatus Kentrum eta TaxID=2126337 RepID=A0A450VB93_9GAMM|nr:MAG: Pentapeptide repeat-containing protein [Candidatus Kentron sp. H]VFJ95855.1 MAG: Pentapeptide repeat-containing protein [Candidatus Kentron sp. H]VFK02049.1 MAG: Pentapeptide repeat-containing protein [Candidatus Kentron sp. H]
MNKLPIPVRKTLWVFYLLTLPLLRGLYGLPWFLYTLSGLRHIVELIWIKRPNAPDYQKPPTFVLWVVGIYVGLYGIAATNHEAALDRVENRMGALASQLATGDGEAFKKLISQIPRIQWMRTPLEPDLMWPFRGNSVFTSLFVREPNPEILQWTRETLRTWKGKLAGVNLKFANLSGAELTGADLSGARLGEIENWKATVSIRKANILGIKNAPEGFREWALEKGAVEMAPAAWKAFVEKGYE